MLPQFLQALKTSFLGLVQRGILNNRILRKTVLVSYKLTSTKKKQYKVLPLIWLDTIPTEDATRVRTGRESFSYPPHFLGRNPFPEKINLPDIYFYTFKKARISAVSSSIIINDEKIIVERASAPYQEIHSYACGHIRAHNQSDALVCITSPTKLSSGIFLGGNGSWNYYHWMLELLSKLEFFTALTQSLQSFPLLINEEILATPSLKDTLEIFTRCLPKPLEIIALKKNHSYVVDDLFYINSPNTLPFNLHGNNSCKCTHSSIDAQSINFLRNPALKLALLNSTHEVTSNIFLARKNVRRIYNQDEVFRCLEKFGFKKVFFEDMGFLEQVKIIYQAKFIVGPTGAAWTNLIFANSGAKALCWMAEDAGDFSAYSNIAKIVGVDLLYTTYKADVKSVGEIYSKEYLIDIDSLELGLNELGLVFQTVKETPAEHVNLAT